jgi:hypothetical protein
LPRCRLSTSNGMGHNRCPSWHPVVSPTLTAASVPPSPSVPILITAILAPPGIGCRSRPAAGADKWENGLGCSCQGPVGMHSVTLDTRCSDSHTAILLRWGYLLISHGISMMAEPGSPPPRPPPPSPPRLLTHLRIPSNSLWEDFPTAGVRRYAWLSNPPTSQPAIQPTIPSPNTRSPSPMGSEPTLNRACSAGSVRLARLALGGLAIGNVFVHLHSCPWPASCAMSESRTISMFLAVHPSVPLHEPSQSLSRPSVP